MIQITTIKPWPSTVWILGKHSSGIEPLFQLNYIRRKKMKQYLIRVTVDTNDADYNESSNYIDESELAEIKAAFNLIDKYASHNWPSHDYVKVTVREMYKDILTEQQIDLIRDLCPTCENGFHSIESVTIIEVVGGEETIF